MFGDSIPKTLANVEYPPGTEFELIGNNLDQLPDDCCLTSVGGDAGLNNPFNPWFFLLVSKSYDKAVFQNVSESPFSYTTDRTWYHVVSPKEPPRINVEITII